MRQQAFYPTVFQPEAEGGYTVTFPDLEGAVTYGADMEEAYKMATEVLGMTLVHFDVWVVRCFYSHLVRSFFTSR